MPRLFICVWLPDDIVEKIMKIISELQNTCIKAKFVERENLHITVAFLGDVNRNKIDDIKMKLDESMKDINEFHVNLKNLKLIPNQNHIRVIGIGIEGAEIGKLISNVGEKVGGKFHEETKITLCRVKEVPNKIFLEEFIQKNCNVDLGSFHVNKVSLVKSELTRSGPKYETLYKSRLKKNEREFSN